MDVRPIRNDDDHRAAVLEIEHLWNFPDGSPEADRMDVLATLVDFYEARRWPVTAGSPQDVLVFAIDEMGHTQAELAEVLRSRSQASDLLKGRRRVSLATARRISSAWNIPIQLLVAPYEADAA